MALNQSLPRKGRSSNRGPVEINKHGQALGRKGNETRQLS
jgi:hypothetical protein